MRGRRCILFLCLATGMSEGGCAKKGGELQYGTLSCLEGWPEQPAAEVLASLTATPAILWQANLGIAAPPLQSGVALSNDRVIVSAAASWAALDRRTGGVLFVERTSPPNYFLSAPVVDREQRIYAQSKMALHAYDADHTLRWVQTLDTPSSSEAEYASFTPTLVGDDLIVVSSLDGERALNAAGSVSWMSSRAVPSFGVGHWALGHDGKASFVTDLRTAKPAGRLKDAAGRDVVFLTILGGRGIVVAATESTGIRLELLDSCGQQVWSLPPVAGSEVAAGRAVVGPGEVVYAQIVHTDSLGNQSRPPDIVAIDPGGQIVAGPISRVETPWLVGADGTLYALEFRSFRSSSKLVALSPLLVEKWSIDVPAEFGSYPIAALADDGVLYAQGGTGQGTTVVAIQTTSPGLAHSSWPSFRHDNRSTSWGGGRF